jgi:hypothetical protein
MALFSMPVAAKQPYLAEPFASLICGQVIKAKLVFLSQAWLHSDCAPGG